MSMNQPTTFTTIQMSDTPETDNEQDRFNDGLDVTPWAFARKLECERDAARADAERLAQVVRALQIYAEDEGGNYAAQALAAHETLNAKAQSVNP